MMPKVYAQTSLGGTIGGAGLGPFGSVGGGSTSGLTAITKIVSSVIGVMTVVAGLWFLFQITIAGIAWISAGGEKSKLTEAKDRLTNAFIGLVIVVAGWAILALAGQFLGYDILISNPDAIMQQLKIN